MIVNVHVSTTTKQNRETDNEHQSTGHAQKRNKSAETVPEGFQALELQSPQKTNVSEVIDMFKGKYG